MARRVAIAVSGGGRSLANLLQRQRPEAGYTVAGVVASRADCKAVAIARDARLPLFVGDFAAGQAQATGEALYRWLAAERVDWLALAGFLKLLPLDARWQGRVVNIHPSLLPRFGGRGMYGDRVHAAVIASGAQESGATVHYVTGHYDEGSVIAQARVPVEPGDDAHTLAARVFAAECELYPRVLDRLIDGTLPLPDKRVASWQLGADGRLH